METTIKKFYKESNVTNDISGDYVEIKMSWATMEQLKDCLIDAWINGRNGKKARRILEILDKAKDKEPGIFY